MNPRVKGALFGAAIGAAVGALYGFMFVAYRERMAAQQVLDETVQVPEPAPNGTLLEPEISDVERQPDHRASVAQERMKRITVRAKELRQAEPDLEWKDAVKRAAREGREDG